MATKKRILQGNRITFGGDVKEFNPSQWENTSFVPLDAETEPVPENNTAGFWRTAGDVGIKAAQGVVDLGSGVVGLTSLASGGLTGKAMRGIGYDPQRTNEILGEYLSDAQKEADNKVASADGFVDSAATMLSEPRALMGGMTRSLPSMVGGLAVTRALATRIGMTAAMGTAEGLAARNTVLQAGGNTAQAAEAALSTQAGAKAAQAAIESAGSKLIATGAISEGAQTAGKVADDAQAAGREYSDYALPAAGAGALTAGIGFGAGKLMGDSATRLVTGANSTGIKGSFGTRVAKDMFSEGVLEEMPQSAQEQYMTNIAMGERDRMKDVGNAAGSGLVAGAAMGGLMGGAQNLSSPHVSPEELALESNRVPESGALTRAANAGLDAQIDQVRTAVNNPINSVVNEEQNIIDPVINAPLVEPQSLAIPEQQITQELAPSLAVENVEPQISEPLALENAVPETQNAGEVSLPDAGIVAQEAETTNQEIEPVQQTEQVPQVEQTQQAEAAPIETILHSSGKPFTTKIGAVTKQKSLGDNYEIAKVDGGYVVQSIQNKPNEVSTDQQPNQQSVESQQSTIDNLMKLAKEEKGIDKPTIFNRAFQRGILDVVNGVKSNAPTSAYTAGRDFAQAKLNTDTQVSAPDSQDLTLETQPQIANEKEANQILEGDIQHPKGFPFKTKHGAIKAQKIHGGELVPVEGGYVVRPIAQVAEQENVQVEDVPTSKEANAVDKELSSSEKETETDSAQKIVDDKVLDAGNKASAELKDETVVDVKPETVAEEVSSTKAETANVDAEDKWVGKSKATETKSLKTISDFGEHLEGAKKDLWQSYQKSMTLALPTSGKDITLSKHFPEPNYESLIDAGVDVRILAAVKAMRDEIPAKPRRPIAVRMWGDRVRVLHGFAADLLSGKHDVDYVVSEMKKGGLAEFADRIEAYAELGYPAFTQAQNYSISGGWVSPSSGESQFALQLNGRHQGMFDTHSKAVDAMRTAIEKDAGKEKKTKSVNLDIYKYRGDGNIVIGKKVASGKYLDLKGGFATFGEARAYLDGNKPELMELLAKKKEVSPERRDTNNSRVGADIRNDVDVTPEKFDSEFGFRGVQFGNYVEQGRRTEDLNNAFDALHDMAAMIGIPNKAVSLNGTLGLAFGARGSGGKGAAMAHFEPNEVVINLTKSKGAGSLGHEWFHALDNYFARAAGLGNVNDAHITSQYRSIKADMGVRAEVISAYKELMTAIKSTQLIERSKQLDNRKSKDYWSTEHELSARAFEAYLIDKASKDNASNDYLANIFDEDTYKDDPYPYPTKEEQKTINPAFDKLFSVIKSKETDNGIALYSRISSEQKELPATIEVDGVDRPTTNSNGKPLATTEEGVKNFWRWFGDSSVVDADGKPLVAYHGTKNSFNEFRKDNIGSAGGSTFGSGFYFTDSQKIASFYAEDNIVEGDAANVLPAYVSIVSPLMVNGVKEYRQFIDSEKQRLSINPVARDRLLSKSDEDLIIDAGYDGVIATYNNHITDIVAFNPTQIKSATGNNGKFNENNPDIRHSLTGNINLKRSTDEYRFGIPNEILSEFVDDVTTKWKNAPKVNVVEYVSELPFKAPNDVRGAYYKGQVYLVASRIGSVSEAQMVLFHEALGHAGLRELFGDGIAPALRSIGMKNRNIAVDAAKWRKENADIRGQKTDDQFLTLSIEEVLADMAGEGKEISNFTKLVSYLQGALRKIGLDSVADWLEGRTNAEVLNVLASAKKRIEKGNDLSYFGEPEAQLFSISNNDNIDDNALEEITSIGDAFKYPISKKTELPDIIKDYDLDIKVRKITNIPGETRYELTLPDETIARVMVRPFNKYGKSIYGYDMDADNQMTNQVDERPGKFPEEAHGKGDVWIDVSLLNEGGGMGTAIYQAVANYAHNNDLVFIGDPAGVTREALLRRPEQMLSSALKFGTSEHIAPHPKQIKGDAKNGIAPIDWVYGDHVGNIQKLIDVTLQNIDNVGGNGGIEYDKQSGQFIDSGGSRITVEDLRRLAKAGLGRSASAGGRTLARYAFLKSVLSPEGHQGQAGRKSSELLVRLGKRLRDHVSTVDKNGQGVKEIFYSRGSSSVAEISDILRSANTLSEATTAVRSILDPNSHFGIWDRTVGTQFNKAKKDADFKKVFDASQQQIDDVAHFAIESERLAPSILRRLDGFRDNAKAVFSSNNAHQVNLKAVSSALFANIAGKKGVQQKVFTDQELVSDFNLTPKQIEMYREARLTIDTSLDRLSQSIIASMGRTAGMDIASLKNSSLNQTADKVSGLQGLPTQASVTRLPRRGQRQLGTRSSGANMLENAPGPPVKFLASASDLTRATFSVFRDSVRSGPYRLPGPRCGEAGFAGRLRRRRRSPCSGRRGSRRTCPCAGRRGLRRPPARRSATATSGPFC